MGNMLIALAPVVIFGVISFGLYALLNLVVSVVFAELSEFIFCKASKKAPTNSDLSAAITGILLAMVIPPTTPLWMTALGAIFAIIVVKEFFGGLGANVFNPALAGRAFLLMSFPAAITTWAKPGSFMAGISTDAVTAATILPSLNGRAETAISPDAISAASMHFFTKTGSETALSQGYSSYGDLLRDLFFGNVNGSTGETSAMLIITAFVYLVLSKTIDWRSPVSMVVTVFIMSVLLGKDPLLAILSGGLLFGAVYMTTDYVTGPVTAMGKVIFGIGCGIIVALIRSFGSYPEGVCYSILIMNMVTPFLNRLVQRKYGAPARAAVGARRAVPGNAPGKEAKK
jgi:electron transport complex protein RnfD